MPSIAAVLKREVFKVTRREFTTLSGGLQHMKQFVGEFFLHSLFYCIGDLFYCITIDFYSTTSATVGLLHNASVLTMCLYNACLAVKAHFWNFNKNDHRAVSSSSVL